MASDPPSPPWKLGCAWCSFHIVVNARGMRGRDMGSGHEAATLMQNHIREAHSRSWREYLDQIRVEEVQ